MKQHKRKHSDILGGSPHAKPHLSTYFHKTVFVSRHKRSKTTAYAPPKEEDMTELVQFILAHEEAFKSRARLTSLYADFRLQANTNPEGYQANLAVWQKALTDAARAGVIPAPGGTHDLLTIQASDELVRALQHTEHGKPTCLPAVFQDAVKKKQFIPLKDFLHSQTSIYKTAWIPSVWSIAQWAWSMVISPGNPDRLSDGDFVVLKNVEAASNEILRQMKDQIQAPGSDRILSTASFLKRFSRVLNPATPLTTNDLNVLLRHMARDKQALSFNAQTIKFKAATETEVPPITDEDAALVNLRDTADRINAQLPVLQAKIEEADLHVRNAVRTNQTIRAKAALRSKKMAESAFAERSRIALQLEEAFMGLQRATDQVHIIQAMKAGVDAMKGLHHKVGGVEGVQEVVDAVKEETATVDEITSIINESATPIDEGELDDEFEALEKAEQERREKEEAEKTAARLAELEAAEQARKEQGAAEENEKEQIEDAETQETTDDLRKLSVTQENADGTRRHEEQERVPVAA